MFATLAEAHALVAHPDFSWTNPNRLRSVVATFAGANLEVKRGNRQKRKVERKKTKAKREK
jgi:hypothetical protein